MKELVDATWLPVFIGGLGFWYSVGLYWRIQDGRTNWFDRAFEDIWSGVKYVLLFRWVRR